MENNVIWPHLSSMKPSDKRMLSYYVNIDDEAFIESLLSFVNEWQFSDWIDENSIERIGRWISNHHKDVRDKLLNRLRNDDNDAIKCLLHGLGDLK